MPFWSRRWRWMLLPAALVAAAVVVAVLVGSDLLPENPRAAGAFLHGFESRFGPGASLALLYLEESGVPLPVPGDVYVIYLGHRTSTLPLGWLAAWAAIIVVVTAGATNLYLISRRWGRRLVRGRVGAFAHLTPERLERAERWFSRWGALAIIFGRHIPGGRVPITVAAGTFQVPYRTFIVSVVISTAAWAGIWLALGRAFGPRVGHFVTSHHATYWVGAVLVAGLVVLLLINAWRAARAPLNDL